MICLFLLQLFLFLGNVSTDTDTTAYEAYTHYNEGVYCSEKGNIRCAIDKYKASLSFMHDFPEAHQNIALLLEQQENFTEAVKHHEMSIKFARTNEFNASALNNLAILSLKLTTVKRRSTVLPVISLLQEATILSPYDANIIFTLGLIMLEIDDHDEAVKYFRNTLDIEPKHSMALLNIGNYYFLRNDFSQANFYYEKSVDSALERGPLEQVIILSNMGQCYREQGFFDKALTALHKAIQLLTVMTSKESSQGGHQFVHSEVQLDTMLLTISNAFAVKGLSCDWRDYEALEELLQSFIEIKSKKTSQSMIWDIELTIKSGSNLYPLHSSFKSNLISLLTVVGYYDSNNSAFKSNKYHKYYEPHTFSLLRYFSTNSDRIVCQRSCPPGIVHFIPVEVNQSLVNDEDLSKNSGINRALEDVDKENSSKKEEENVLDRSQLEIHRGQKFEEMNVDGRFSSRSLRVGYLSYDMRSHPMGRLVQTLVTSHNSSKVAVNLYILIPKNYDFIYVCKYICTCIYIHRYLEECLHMMYKFIVTSHNN